MKPIKIRTLRKPRKKKERRKRNTPHNLATAFVIALQMPASTRRDQRHHVLQLLGKQILGNLLGEKKRVYEFASQIPRKEETHNANLVLLVGGDVVVGGFCTEY